MRKKVFLFILVGAMLAMAAIPSFAQVTDAEAVTNITGFSNQIPDDFWVYARIGFAFSVALGTLGLFIRRQVRR